MYYQRIINDNRLIIQWYIVDKGGWGRYETYEAYEAYEAYGQKVILNVSEESLGEQGDDQSCFGRYAPSIWRERRGIG